MIIILAIIFLAVLLIFGIFTAADKKVLFAGAETFSFNGVDRTYRIYVPKNLSSDPKMIFAFHGFGSNSWQMAYTTALHNSTGSDTIVVYPDASKPTEKGQKTGWNAGFCCGSGYVNNVDDVTFTRELAVSLAQKYNIKKDKIFATGFSNGGMFVNRLAAESKGIFRGYASVSGSIGTASNSLNPKNPAAMLLLHGESDRNVPYDGGPGASDQSFDWIGFSGTKAAWEQADQASEPTQTNVGNTHITNYNKHDETLKTITYSRMGHQWPGWRLGKFWHKHTEGSQQVVEFFNQLHP